MFGACKGLGAGRARVRLVAVVQLDVTTQVPDASKQHAANAAAELHHSVGVTDHVRLRVLHDIRLYCTHTIHKQTSGSAPHQCCPRVSQQHAAAELHHTTGVTNAPRHLSLLHTMQQITVSKLSAKKPKTHTGLPG